MSRPNSFSLILFSILIHSNIHKIPRKSTPASISLCLFLECMKIAIEKYQSIVLRMNDVDTCKFLWTEQFTNRMHEKNRKVA